MTCSDGARNITRRVRGIATFVASLVDEEGCNLIRFWFGSHQLDLAAQAVVCEYCSDEFYSTLTGVMGYLRRQRNLVNEVRIKFLKVATTRWLSLGKVFPWFSKNQIRVIEYFG